MANFTGGRRAVGGYPLPVNKCGHQRLAAQPLLTTFCRGTAWRGGGRRSERVLTREGAARRWWARRIARRVVAHANGAPCGAPPPVTASPGYQACTFVCRVGRLSCLARHASRGWSRVGTPGCRVRTLVRPPLSTTDPGPCEPLRVIDS